MIKDHKSVGLGYDTEYSDGRVDRDVEHRGMLFRGRIAVDRGARPLSTGFINKRLGKEGSHLLQPRISNDRV